MGGARIEVLEPVAVVAEQQLGAQPEPVAAAQQPPGIGPRGADATTVGAQDRADHVDLPQRAGALLEHADVRGAEHEPGDHELVGRSRARDRRGSRGSEQSQGERGTGRGDEEATHPATVPRVLSDE